MAGDDVLRELLVDYAIKCGIVAAAMGLAVLGMIVVYKKVGNRK